MLSNLRSINTRIVEELTELSTYPQTEEGFQNYIDNLHELFKKRDEDLKEKVKQAGGYPIFYQIADKYFGTGADTVEEVTNGFLRLIKRKDVVGDTTGYRYRIMEYFDDERGRFAFPSHFSVALQLCIMNGELS